MHTSIQLDRPGGHLAALCLGDADGEPVLALHGWRDNAASFIPLSGHLPGYRVVVPDFPGHGHSVHRPAGDGYLFVDYVADVAHAVAGLGWRHFHLVGHSLGANVALAYSAVFPERIRSLVLIEGVGPTSGDAGDTVNRLRRSIEAELDPEPPRRGGYPDWQTLIDARRRASPVSRDGAELLVRRNAREEAGEIRLHTDRRLRNPSAMYLTEAAVMEFVRGVEAPTLVILADQGTIIDRDVTHQRIAALGNAEKAVLPGNHHLHLDVPAEVAGAMLPFLGSRARKA
ncbi:MAG: alpha/beta hydrolase [Gammaproteobacteria bacterium]|nr:alpha/beta hydrolase [Gammaproteobacteria bacterium]